MKERDRLPSNIERDDKARVAQLAEKDKEIERLTRLVFDLRTVESQRDSAVKERDCLKADLQVETHNLTTEMEAHGAAEEEVTKLKAELEAERKARELAEEDEQRIKRVIAKHWPHLVDAVAEAIRIEKVAEAKAQTKEAD